jgi:hypothetical protein
VTATETAFNAKATIKYIYNQNSAGKGDITEIIANDACGGTNCGTPLQFFSYVTYTTNAIGQVVQSVSSTQTPANGYQYSYTIQSGWTSASQVKVTLPDASKRTFVFDQAGYVVNDNRNVGVSGTNAEYTVFKRDLQTIGTVGNATGTTEFVGRVEEQDQKQLRRQRQRAEYDHLAKAWSHRPREY